MRVPILTIMIANAINRSSKGTPGLTPFTKDQFDELVIAAWLHDCGKLIVPEHVMDKSTKLETVCDRLEVINERFEVIRRDIKIHYLEQLQRVKGNDHAKLEKKYVQDIADLDQAKEFIREVNRGGEFLPDDDKQRIRQIASKYSYHDGNKMKPLLTEDEVISLSVSRGTLNDEEREIIQSHVKHTKTMLESLTYPANLQNVPEIAGSHHERMDGKGYPSGKTRSDLTLQARVLMIADIFEALTCADRPYKKAKKLKEVLAIMEDMKNNGHIDPDIYDLFIREKIYLNYARQYLDPGQIDTGE
ncbi:HD-GYP domain-containing protein [Aquicella siphonis]|nr:HD domain-containing phosphohydrolase [Aquicella siphonis]